MESLLEALKKGRINEGQTINDNGYFDTYKDNIFGVKMETRFQKMFDEGSGGELHSKAEAVHSSSMLSYNFFHWIDENHTFTWKNIEYNQVLFEVKMKTIKGSNAPACMDVVLIDKKKENLLFIESKFTEYTEAKKFKLSESYRDSNKWFYDKEKIDWNEIINYATEASKEKNYNEGIKQIITHLFGIHNLLYVKGHNIKVKDKKEENIASANIKFFTLVFEPKVSKFEQEHKNYDNYYNNLFKPFRNNLEKLKKVGGLSVIPEWRSYSDLWNEMKEQIPSKELKNFLWERYMQFAEGVEKP